MKNICIILTFLFSIQSVFGQLTRDLAVFRKLDVTDKIIVKIIPSKLDRIVIEGELANQMEVIQVGDELRLKMTGTYMLKGDKASVALYSSALSAIVARKGATVSNHDSLLELDSIDLEANEGANINLFLEAKKVEGDVTTGGSIELRGKALVQDVNVALGGSYLARDFYCEDIVARVSGGGRVEVNASKNVDVQTRAGGLINIYGNPKNRTQKKMLGGKINYL